MTAVNYGRLRSLPARRLVSALERDGIELSRQSGSPRHKHPDGRRVTVTFHHSSDTFRFKTLRSIIEAQARWTDEDLQRLELL